MLTILTGAAGSGKTRAVCEEIRSRMREHAGMVLLTPEQQTHRAERTLSALCGPELSLHAEVLSFTRLYHRVAVETGGLADPIPDRGGKLLLMARALEAVSPQMKRFGERSRRLDFLDQLLRTVEELQSARIGAEPVRGAAAHAAGSMGEKLHDVALVLESYEAVSRAQLGDARDLLGRLADALGESTAGAGGIWADGFTDFTAAELRVLEAVLRRGTDLTVTLTLTDGDDAAADGRFAVTEGTARQLADLAARHGTELRFVSLPEPPEGPFRTLAENLFRYEAAPVPGCADATVRSARLRSFPEECRYAAAQLRRCLREDPSLRWGDAAVVIPGFEARRGAAEDAFREFGIPFFTAETENLRDSGAALWLTETLSVIADGWRPRDLLRALKTGFGGLTPEETDRLERYCLTWELRGERVWRREADWSLPPNGYGTPAASDAEELREINRLRRLAAEPVGRLADALRCAQTAGQQVRALYAYLEETHFADRLREKAEFLSGLGDRTAAERTLRLWDLILGCFEQLDAVLGDARTEIPELRRLLELLFGSRELGAIPASADCVSLGGPARLRGSRPKILLILGADEEHLPELRGSAGLFSGEERRQLFDLGLKLGGSRDADLDRALLELYELAAAPSGQLLMSWSGDADTRPCLLIRRAETLLGVHPVQLDTLPALCLAEAGGPLLRLAVGTGSWSEAAAAVLDGEPEALREEAARTRGSLTPETADRLFGETVRLTASRAETWSRCRYRYFLQYGLEAKEDRAASFDAPAVGTFLHEVLQGVCTELRDAGDFKTAGEERLRALTRKHTAAYAEAHFRAGQAEEPRFRYLFDRLCRSAEEIVRNLVAELAAGDFEPLDFELHFGGADGLPPLREPGLSIGGVADRVDGWCDGDSLYLLVADYKTGKTRFSLSDVWYGLSMQMLIYLFLLGEEGSRRYHGKIVPAGVLYAPAREELVRTDRNADPESVEKERAKKLQRSGLLLADGRMLRARENSDSPRYLPVKYGADGEPSGSLAAAAQLGALARHVHLLLQQMGRDLHQGGIQARPLSEKQDAGGCATCPYGRICGFDPERDEVRLKKKLSDEEFWNAIREEVPHG